MTWHLSSFKIGLSASFNYNFNIIGAPPATQRTIVVQGQVQDSNGKIFTHREIQVTIDDIIDNVDNLTGLPPPDGIDDDMAGSEIVWSWRDI